MLAAYAAVVEVESVANVLLLMPRDVGYGLTGLSLLLRTVEISKVI